MCCPVSVLTDKASLIFHNIMFGFYKVRAYGADKLLYSETKPLTVTTYMDPFPITLKQSYPNALEIEWQSPPDNSVARHTFWYSTVSCSHDTDPFRLLQTLGNARVSSTNWSSLVVKVLDDRAEVTAILLAKTRRILHSLVH